MVTRLVVNHLGHDLTARKSYVTLGWADDPTKRLGVEVPFGTIPADAEGAAKKALAALIVELQNAELTVPIEG